MWKIDLSGKTALVTGASRGIGRAVARALAQAGARVVVNHRDNEILAGQVVREIKEKDGGEAMAWQADVGRIEEVREMVRGIESQWEGVDILVNNAGMTRDLLLLQMGEEDWRAVLETNLWGVYHCSQGVAPRMVMRRWGRIINVSSVAAAKGRPGQTHYAASKGAVEAFTRSLASELGTKGITVNAIAPGLVETDMTRAILPHSETFVHERVALRRHGQPEDIAPLVVFLASDAGAYVTGQVISVDGGMF